MANVNVSLPEPMTEWVDERVRNGPYENDSDYVRDLIRHDQERREALIQALIEAEQSGISQRTVQDIVTDTKSKIANGEI